MAETYDMLDPDGADAGADGKRRDAAAGGLGERGSRPGDAAGRGPGDGADDGGDGPLEVVGSLAEGLPAGDFCPRCGKAMGASSVVCTNCGFDLRTGETAKGFTPGVAKKADVEAAAVPDDGRMVLCATRADGRAVPPVKVLIVGGGLCALVGAILAGVYVGGEVAWWVRPARAFLVLMGFGIHTASGVGALYLAAIWLEARVGSLEVATGRMAAAVGVFLMVLHFPVPAGGFAGMFAFVLAILAYLVVVCALFWRRLEVGLKVAVMHVAVAALLQGGLLLYHTAAGAAETAAAATAAAAR